MSNALAHWPAGVRRRRGRIATTYVVTVVEQGFDLLYPLAIGIAVDGLLAGRPTSLSLLVGVWLAHALTGVARQLYDTRLFTALYADAVTDMVDGQPRASAAELAGRAALARQLVDFLEYDVPAALRITLACIGSLVLLTAYAPVAGGLAVLLLAPVTALNWRYGRRAAALNAELNDAAEREVDVIATRQRSVVAGHFASVARLRVRLSDAEARTWGVAELFAIALTVAVLLLLTRGEPRTPGEILAALAYLWALLDAVAAVPATLERTVAAYDVTRRLTPRGTGLSGGDSAE